MQPSSFLFRPLTGLLLLTFSAQAEPAPVVSIPALVTEITTRNPELAFYEAELAIARAGRQAAGSRDNPELAVEIGRKRVTDATGALAGEGTAWTVSVSQTFDWPGRLALRKAIANQDIALAELGLARFQAALVARARALAYGLHAAHERAAAAAEVAARYQALRELYLAREPGGITPLLETRVIEAQELTLRHRATEAQLAVQAALVELNQLRGLPVDTPIRISAAPLTFQSAPSTDALLAAARENHFDFLAAKLELEQQGLVVSLARHEGKPGITLSPYYSQEKAGDQERTFGLGLSLPLPVSRRTGASVAAAHTFAAKLAETAGWSPDAAQKFREAADLADRHYRLGAVPVSTYVELQNSYLDAIDALYETRLETLAAAGQLQLLTGLDLQATENRP